ncbi:MAG: ATP-binding protein [archaeon]
MENEKDIYEFLKGKRDSHVNRLWLRGVKIDNGVVIGPNKVFLEKFRKHYREPLKEFYGKEIIYEIGTNQNQPREELFVGNDRNEIKINPSVSHDNNRIVLQRKRFGVNDYFFSHNGNRIAEKGLEIITDDVLKGKFDDRRYLFYGPNGVRKSAIAKHFVRKLTSENVPVAYIDVNEMIGWLTKYGGEGTSPRYFYEASDSKFIVLDEFGKVHNKKGSLLPGTQSRIVKLFNEAEEKGVPVAMFYTGGLSSYKDMVSDLYRKGDGFAEKTARDLASRLGWKIPIEIRGISEEDRAHFVLDYLNKKKDVPENLLIGDVARGINDCLPDNPSFREIIGESDAVVFNAMCNPDVKFGYDEAVSVLRGSDQGEMFRGEKFSSELLDKACGFAGVDVCGLKGNRTSVEKAFVAWVLVGNEEKHGNIAKMLKVGRSTIPNYIKRIDNILKSDASKLNKADLKLRGLVEDWEKR